MRIRSAAFHSVVGFPTGQPAAQHSNERCFGENRTYHAIRDDTTGRSALARCCYRPIHVPCRGATSDEHELLRQTVRQFALTKVEPQALEHDEKQKFNVASSASRRARPPRRDILKRMRRRHDARLLSRSRELAYADPGFTLATSRTPFSSSTLLRRAPRTKRKRLLPKTLSGEWVGAMGMTEPAVGTDVLGMQTVGAAKVTSMSSTVPRRSSQRPRSEVFVSTRSCRTDHDLIIERETAGFSVGAKISSTACARLPWRS